MNKLSLEMLKLIQKQQTKIDFLKKRLKNATNHLIRNELEVYILVNCLYIIADKYNISHQEKKAIIFQAIEEIFL